MSSTTREVAAMGKAESKFREAFERLKRNSPHILPKGSLVTQNNVAKEAGVQPSALRRTRLPALAQEIEEWKQRFDVQEKQVSPRKASLANRNRNRDLQTALEKLKLQRDDALLKLVVAEEQIVALASELEALRMTIPRANVTPLRGKTRA